ncbi:MAG: sulfite exporter TauE/SafE family protein [Microthrixaceae bacterium]
MRALLASPLGFLVGLSLGALGGGGSILAVPALVYGVGETARAATGTSLIVVGAAALVGLVPHWRRGHVRLREGLLFGAAGIGGSFLGTALNRGVDPDVLLVAFSVFMLVAASGMWRRARQPAPDPEPVLVGVPGGPTATEPGAASEAVVPDAPSAPSAPSVRRRFDPRATAGVLVAGTVVGALTGFFGVGGGFVIVPALVLTLGFVMPEAVGTSLVVIAVNAAVALAMRAGNTEIDWSAAAPFLVTAVVGTVVGGRLAERVDPRRLTSAFVVLLVGVAVVTGISAASALAAA